MGVLQKTWIFIKTDNIELHIAKLRRAVLSVSKQIHANRYMSRFKSGMPINPRNLMLPAGLEPDM